MPEFLFATGIECSAPTIENGRWRMDELEMTGHYRQWRRDLDLVVALGLKHLRYGVPLHRVFTGPDRYDWSWLDPVMERMKEIGIVPILDLCHFGVPDWLENFQNPRLPEALARYAGAVAARYPWVRYFTPVNEMYVTARFSALCGMWNEQLASEQAYVRATLNVARSSVLMMQAILRERPEAVFVNSESGEFYQAASPDPEIRRIAQFENQRRFIALDLLYGVPVQGEVYAYLVDNGMTREDYEWFHAQTVGRRSVLGVDYYTWNEKVITVEGHVENLGELFGWYVITSQYFNRYRRPVMHTETNVQDARAAPAWLWRQWHNVQLIRTDGVPVLGFTWYSLLDQVDWDIGLTSRLGNVNPVGLFDLNRDARPVAQAYAHLVRMHQDEPLLPWSDVLAIV